MLKISFILPCYNTGKYLCQCVKSLLAQGFDKDEYEIICVDNAATDNTAELLKELSVKYPGVKVVTLPVNKCSGGAYNAGLEVAQGKYVLFVDSDDYLKENSVLPLIEKMESNLLDALFFNIESFRGETELTSENELQYNGNFPEAFTADDGNDYFNKALSFLPFSILPVPAYRKMIRACVLKEKNIQFTQTTVGCDYLHNLQLLSFAKRIEIITEKIYMFRYNPNGVTKSRFSTNAIIYALNNYCEAYHKLPQMSFDDSIKETISSNILSLLDAYVGAMKYIEVDDRHTIFKNLDDLDLIKKIPHGIINRFLCEDGFVSHFLLKASFFNKLNSIRRLV